MLVTHFTTFSIDGLAFMKPVILTDMHSLERYERLGVFYDGTNKDSLKEALAGLSESRFDKHIKNFQSAINECLDSMDDSTSKRIAGILRGQKQYVT